MVRAYFSVVFVLSHLALIIHSAEEQSYRQSCPPSFDCGNLKNIGFPFSNVTNTECGPFQVSDCDKQVQKINLGEEGIWYQISSISQANILTIVNQSQRRMGCELFNNLTLPHSLPYVSFTIEPNITLFKCNSSITPPPSDFKYPGCSSDFNIYYNSTPPDHVTQLSLPPQCSMIQLPSKMVTDFNDNIYSLLLTSEFYLKVHVSWDCFSCHRDGGQCPSDWEGKFRCANAKKDKKGLKLGLGLGIGGSLILIIGSAFFILWRRFKRRYASEYLARNLSSDPNSNSYLERGGAYFGVPIFSYCELEEATNHFDSNKELGDGGFGTVYHGILQDGREVAVKRLYESNYKRVEQFMNEIKILTLLRHKNLVTLYGCTSRHSRELLLVYEYIPNGTVADHLHGDRAATGSVTWPIRMSIAIETASALAYLHASDIIHRDVKTNNILLDDNFCVKVADFGLSRLFPTDVTHISTAPQGTPGYVDPEYHQCYQLTEKSDVYSFGVVLIELISSLPAVDISRHRHEINLSNLAINKIQNQAYNELIDPSLGFELDSTIERMTTAVAELAFQCLQSDKEMRPSMEEVLETLKGIESGTHNQKAKLMEDVGDIVGVLNSNVRPPPSPESEEVVLLNKMQPPFSPISVTEKWVSTATTPSASA